MLNLIILVLYSIIFVFISRIPYLKTFSKSMGADDIRHMEHIKLIQNNKHKIPISYKNKYVFSNEINDYPLGFHKIISFFPLKFLEKNGKLLSILAHSFLGICIGIIIYFKPVNNTISPIFQALVAVTLFVFLRIMYFIPAVAVHISERPWAVLFGNIYLYALLNLNDNLMIYGILLLFCGFYVVNSSKFGIQSLFFFSILLSFIQPYSVLIFIFILCFSSIISKGYTYRVLLGMIRHSSFYFLTSFKSIYTNHSTYQDFFSFFRRLDFRDFSKITAFVESNKLAMMLSHIPYIFLIVFAMLVDNNLFSESNFYWMLSGIFLNIFISTKLLNFLGESIRYLQYCAIPIIIMTTSIFFLDYYLMVLILILFLCMVFTTYYKLKTINIDFENESKDFENLIEYLSFLQENEVCLCIPLSLSHDIGYRLNDLKFVHKKGNIPSDPITLHKMDTLCPKLGNFPDEDLDKSMKLFNSEVLIVEKKYLDYSQNHSISYDFHNLTLKYSNSDYLVYNTQLCEVKDG